MHKKSLEAAEALKNSEDNNSDRDDVHTEASDNSSSYNIRRSVTPTVGTTNSMNKFEVNNTTNEILPKTPSPTNTITVSPSNISPSTPHSHQQVELPQHSNDTDNKTKQYCILTNPPSSKLIMTSSQANFQHFNHHDLQSSHSLGHHHTLNSPDTDPEVFRWVNSDPMSYIR